MLNNIRKVAVAFARKRKYYGFAKALKLSLKRITGITKREEEINTLYYLLNHYVDITKLPPAKGALRKMQLCDAVMLDIFDAVCEKQGWSYWLGAGTLLGAARHKGFIPWDDDLDIYMPRKDYDQVMKKCPEIFSEYGSDTLSAWDWKKGLGVGYKPNQTAIATDIFPVDMVQCGSDDENEAKKLLLERVGKYQKVYYAKNDKLSYEALSKEREAIINAGGGYYISSAWR